MNGFITGTDAIDIAKMAGVQLCRAPCRNGEPPDTSWEAAELSMRLGDSVVDDYSIDLDSLPTEDAGNIILCLIAMYKAVFDYRPEPG